MSGKPVTRLTVCFGVCVMLGVYSATSAAPGSPAAPPAGKSSGSQPTGSPHPASANSASKGAWYALSDTNPELAKPKRTEHAVILCYEVATARSSVQPLIAAPRYPSDPPDPQYKDCNVIDQNHPLVMQNYLIFKIFFDKVNNYGQFTLLNLNITSQPGSPINPMPIRPSVTPAATSPAKLSAKPPKPLGGIYYAMWPYPLAPDADVAVSISVVYPLPVSGSRWTRNTFYPAGSVVTLGAAQGRGHFFTALSSGMSGDHEPTCPSVVLPDGQVSWLDLGMTPPDTKPAPTLWKANTSYSPGDVIQSQWNGHYLVAVSAQTGNSGTSIPIALPQTTQDNDVTWQDSGVSPPVASTPSEQVIGVLDEQPLGHVHALSRYNLTAGIVYSSNHNRTFGFDHANAPVQTGSTPIVDPVLFFTYYPWPIDAEGPYHSSEFFKPGVSLGISLSSPSCNFYLGGMSEIRRNVQLVYGFTVAKVTHLAPAGTFNNPPPSTTATVPATTQKFDQGAYIGLSFNVVGFIGSLFGGSH